jgi:hypothetical protein
MHLAGVATNIFAYICIWPAFYSFVRREHAEGADILAGMIRGQDSHTYVATQGEFEGNRECSNTELVDVDTSASVKNKKKGSRGPRWSIAEDLCLCDSWMAISLDPFNGAQQPWQTYWSRIYDQFNKRKTTMPRWS